MTTPLRDRRSAQPDPKFVKNMSPWLMFGIGFVTLATSIAGTLVTEGFTSGQRVQDFQDSKIAQTENRLQTESRLKSLEGSSRRFEIIMYRLADKLGVRTDDVR